MFVISPIQYEKDILALNSDTEIETACRNIMGWLDPLNSPALRFTEDTIKLELLQLVKERMQELAEETVLIGIEFLPTGFEIMLMTMPHRDDTYGFCRCESKTKEYINRTFAYAFLAWHKNLLSKGESK